MSSVIDNVNNLLKNNQQKTLLHHAAERGNLDAIKYLINEQNLDPQAKTTSGSTVLHYAASSGNLEAIKYLIKEQKLNPTQENNNHTRALDYLDSPSKNEILKFFKECNINISNFIKRNLVVLSRIIISLVMLFTGKKVFDNLSTSKSFSMDNSLTLGFIKQLYRGFAHNAKSSFAHNAESKSI